MYLKSPETVLIFRWEPKLVRLLIFISNGLLISVLPKQQFQPPPSLSIVFCTFIFHQFSNVLLLKNKQANKQRKKQP